MMPEPPPPSYRPPDPPPSAQPPTYDPDLYGPLGPVQPPVRVRVVKLVVVLGLVFGCLIGAYLVARAKGWLVPVAQYRGQMDTDGQAGIKSTIKYPVQPKPQLAATNGGDPDADWKRSVNRRLGEHDAKLQDHETRLKTLEEFMKGKKPPPQPPAQASVTPPKPKVYRSMQFVSNKIEEKTLDEPDTYLLAPGATKLACTVESAMNSDVESYATLKLRNDVYDTATGAHLLAPQGGTILVKYHSQQLLFGNERLPTTSLTLALPNAKSVDIGDAPVMDQKGQAGLVSRVDQHWARLFSSILIMGVLRGGQAALLTQLEASNPAGAVAAGIAGTTNQAGQMRLAPALSTKPTIYVEAGEPCQIILIKELKLPEYRRF